MAIEDPTTVNLIQVTPRKVDIIWNVTLVCPWDCAICCVDAVHVTKRGQQVLLKSHALTVAEETSYKTGTGTAFDQAMRLRQQQGLELDFDGKLRVLDHLKGVLPKIDFSGGDPMSTTENLEVMRIAAERFGKEQITLTATGKGLARCTPEIIIPLIGELNFTYDSVSPDGNDNRPAEYATGNLKKATSFAAAGVKTRGECPLSAQNISDTSLRRIYLDLHFAGIDKLLLMRLFPVGRGAFRASDIPTPAQYRRAINVLRDMEAEFKHPSVKLQCALKFFDTQNIAENPCDLVRESFGLMSDGTLLASPWAVGSYGKPLDDVWVLGNLTTTPLQDILESPKAIEYQRRLDDNFGHCKIFAFLQSKRENSMDRIFDHTDSLYVVNSV